MKKITYKKTKRIIINEKAWNECKLDSFLLLCLGFGVSTLFLISGAVFNNKYNAFWLGLSFSIFFWVLILLVLGIGYLANSKVKLKNGN
ncbi:MAG TPA: hypothetical protein VMZ91_02705 [Candidatus Paceibacterota bacterium]|nr:hypothetical protein [Candidatus Paceibacterota bacterium]